MLKKVSSVKYLVYILVLVSMLASISYALFYADQYIDNNGIDSDNLSLTTETKEISGSTILSNIGSRYSTELTVKADGETVNKGFYYDIAFSAIVKDGKENVLHAILIYIDGSYVGTLSNLMTTSYQVKSPLAVYKNTDGSYTKQSRTHNITLELHIGAGQLFNDSEFNISFTTKARQMTPKDVVFVSTEEDLIQISRGTTSSPNIVLVNNISLSNALAFPNYYNIDVNGYTLNLSGFTFVMNSDKSLAYSIYNSGATGDILGTITLNSTSAIMQNMLTSSKLTIVSESTTFNKDLVFDTYLNNIKIFFKEEITTVTAVDLTKYLSHYIQENNIAILGLDNNVLSYNFPILSITPVDHSVAYNVKFGLTYGTEERVSNLTIRTLGGKDTAIVDEIFNDSMAIFANIQVGDKTEYILNSDVFLPTRARRWDAGMQWITDSPDILSSDGSYNRVFKTNIKLKLSCIISYQGKNFVRTATLSATPLPPEEIVKKITLENRITFASIGEEKDIPSLDRYRDYGITSVAYNLDFNENQFSSILKISGEKLQLFKDTDITEASLQVTVTIDGYSGSYVGYIEIEISILRTKSIFDEIYLHVKNNLELNPSFTLQTFNMPAFYADKKSLIRYDIVDALGNIINPEYISISPEEIGADYTYYKNDPNTKFINNIDYYTFTIDTTKLPQANTILFLKASVKYKDTDEQFKLFSFGILGVLHNTPEDIEDLNLFLALCKLYNKDKFREYIIRDDIDNSRAEKLDVDSNNISSLKGIQFFSRLKEINLSNNNITNISELANFVNLVRLNLSKNVNLVDISTIRYNVNLVYLNLSGNSKIFSLEKLNYLSNLEELYLNDCFPRVDDLSFLSAMIKLKVLYTYNTNISSDNSVYNKNLNYIINSYSKASAFYSGSAMLDYKLTSNSIKVNFSNQELEGNRLLNNISTIYEINNVINLPFDIRDADNNSFGVTWQEDGSQILIIDNGAKTAYINQPIENIDVFIIARIVYKDKTLYRRFKIYSNKGNQVPQIEKVLGEAPVNADTLITDTQLRYEMFKVLDTNESNNIITQAEINAWTKTFMLNLDGKGIIDITGIEYFSTLQLVTLFNNNLNSLAPLGKIADLKEIYLNAGSYDLSQIIELKKLSVLYLVGVGNVRSTENLQALFTIYENNPNIKIYLDSSSTEWNPYREAIEKAVYNNEQLKLAVYLPYRGSITMPNQITNIMVAASKNIAVDLTYKSDVIGTIGTTLTYPTDKMYVTDAYESLNVTATYSEDGRAISVAAEITVVLTAPDDYLVDISTTGTEDYQQLYLAIPSPDLRRALLTSLSTITDKKITKKQLDDTKNITFSCTAETGLSGIKLLRNIETLTLSEYYPTTTVANNLAILTTANFPKLKTLRIAYSYVDMAEIQGISLTTLEVSTSTTVKISNDIGTLTAFSTSLQNSLTTLKLTDCNLYSFEGLRGLKNLSILYLYNNPACSNITDNNDILLSLLGSKASVTYQLFRGVNWSLNTSLEEIALVPNFWESNYIDASSGAVTIEVPAKINGYEAQWTFLNNSMSVTLDTARDIYIITTKNLTTTNYVYNVATLNIPKIAKKQLYTFVIKGSGSAKPHFDMATFLKDGKLKDPTFTYKLLTSFKEGGTVDGEYTTADLANLKALSLIVTYNVNDSTKTSDISGLRYFTNIETLTFRYQMLKDISEIRFLTALTKLSIEETALETLMYDNSGTPTSVLQGLTSLNSLTLTNNNIKDYSFLYSGGMNTLSQIATLIINTYNTTTNRDNLIVAITEWAKARANTGTLTLMGATYNTTTNIATLVKQLAALSDLYNTSGASSPNNVYFDGAVLRIRNEWIISTTTTKDSTTIGLRWKVYNNSTTDSAYGLSIDTNNKMKFTSAVASNYDHEMTLSVGFLLNDGKTIFSKTITAFYSVSETAKGGIVEITTEEKVRYQTKYSLAENLFTKTTTANVYTIAANYLIPDGSLKAEIFSKYANNDNILSLSDRATSINIFSVTKNADITNISGIELLNNTVEIVFENANIEKLSELILPKTAKHSFKSLSFVGNRMLNDISALNYRFDDDCYTINELITNKLSLRNCGKLTVAANSALSFSQASEIDMYNTSLANYEFSKDIYKTNTKLTIIMAPNQENAFTNFDYFQELIMQSYKPYEEIYTNFASNFNPNILSGYLLPQTEYFINSLESDDIINNRLPNSFKRYNKKYYAVYDTTTTLEKDYYQIKEDAKGYYIRFKEGISTFPILSVRVRYLENAAGVRDDTAIYIPSEQVLNGNKGNVRGNYKEDMSVTVKDGIAPPKQDSLYKASDIEIWKTDASGNNIKLSSIVPDVVLRVLILENFIDVNNNRIMDESEALAITSILAKSKYEYVNVLEGIGIFANLEELSLIRCNALDLSPLSGMTKLKKLKLSNSQDKIVIDLSPLSSISSLEEINLSFSVHGDISFIMSLPKLKFISYIDNIGNGNLTYDQSPSKYAGFMDMSLAYSRVYYRLDEYSENIETPQSGQYLSTLDQKKAAIILGEAFKGLSIYNNNQLEELSIPLPTEVNYLSINYNITYISLSSYLAFNQNVPTIDNITNSNFNKYRNKLGFLAVIKLNGMCYTRYLCYGV